MDPVNDTPAAVNQLNQPAMARRAWCATCGVYTYDGEEIPCSKKSGYTWQDCELSTRMPEVVPYEEKIKHDEDKAKLTKLQAQAQQLVEKTTKAAPNTIPLSAHGVQELLSRPDFSDRAERTWNELMAKETTVSDPEHRHPDTRKAIDLQVGGDHYKSMPIQPVEYMMANRIPFPEGNIIKYVTRWRTKGGIGDLEKARHMLDVLIEFERDQGTK